MKLQLSRFPAFVLLIILWTTAGLAQDDAVKLSARWGVWAEESGLSIAYPEGWLAKLDGQVLVANELEVDHERALGRPFLTEGYSLRLELASDLTVMRILHGLPAEDPTLEDLLRAFSAALGYAESTDSTEAVLAGLRVISVRTTDEVGNAINTVQGFIGVDEVVAYMAFNLSIAAPSHEVLDDFLPTWEAILSSMQFVELSSEFVDIGGYELFITCAGEGSPTVIYDAGLSMPGASYIVLRGIRGLRELHGEIATFTRMCVYDRAGLGASDNDPSDAPRTSQKMVDELHALLVNAEIEEPYILVGFSLGGLNTRLYAHQYPDDVFGLVLVDSQHEDREVRFQEVLSPEEYRMFETQMQSAYLSEHLDLDASLEQVGATGSLGTMPLIVLTATMPEPFDFISDEHNQEWQRIWVEELQPDLASLSTNSTQVLVSTHHWLIFHSVEVRKAVYQLVSEFRAEDN